MSCGCVWVSGVNEQENERNGDRMKSCFIVCVCLCVKLRSAQAKSGQTKKGLKGTHKVMTFFVLFVFASTVRQGSKLTAVNWPNAGENSISLAGEKT